MMQYKKEKALPAQGDRTPRVRHEGSTVPAPLGSSSRDGLSGVLRASTQDECAIAQSGPSGPRRKGLPSKAKKPAIKSNVKVSLSQRLDLVRGKRKFTQAKSTAPQESTAEMEDLLSEDNPPPPAKRGKSKPTTSGDYVDLATSKARFAQAEREELEIKLTKQLLEHGIDPPTSSMYERKAGTITREALMKYQDRPTADLRATILQQTQFVEGLSRSSPNLKGTLIKAMQLCALRTRAAMTILTEREEDNGASDNAALLKEVRELRKKNMQLQITVDNLRMISTAIIPLPKSSSENEKPIKTMSGRKVKPAIVESTDDDIRPRREKVCAGSVKSEQDMLRNLESRLFERLERVISSKLDSLLDGIVGTGDSALRGGEDLLMDDLAVSSQVQHRDPTPDPPLLPAPASSSRSDEVQWRMVGPKGKINKVMPQENLPSQDKPLYSKVAGTTKPKRGKPTRTQNKAKTADKKPAKKKKKAKRSAAVSMTVLDGTYVETLKKARQIELADQVMRARRSMTGGYIFEFPGANGTQHADSFAEKLKSVFQKDLDNVKIARPCRQVEIRVNKIVDSFTACEIQEALANAGGCKIEEVAVGQLMRAPDRMNAIWSRLPETAADKLLESGRLQLGWSQAVLVKLDPRKLQCFRCLRFGHVKANCAFKDRSSVCYRCGQAGHQAKNCNLTVSCLVCRECGLPHNHRMGGKACKPPPSSQKGKGKGGKGQDPGAAVKGRQVTSRPPPAPTPKLKKASVPIVFEKTIEKVLQSLNQVTIEPCSSQSSQPKETSQSVEVSQERVDPGIASSVEVPKEQRQVTQPTEVSQPMEVLQEKVDLGVVLPTETPKEQRQVPTGKNSDESAEKEDLPVDSLAVDAGIPRELVAADHEIMDTSSEEEENLKTEKEVTAGTSSEEGSFINVE